jgi:acetolactate synthase-1/2/3 large subunit
MDVLGLEPENPDELDEKIEEMINIDKPVIFDCHVDQAENCFPNDPIRKTS